MSNSVYVSPRLYASKYKTKKSNFELGIGYAPLPEGMSKAEFKRMYSEWERKLAESGFEDIEYRSPNHSGMFSSYFRKNGSTATFQALYDPATEEYYRLARSFNSYMFERPAGAKGTRWSVKFRGESLLYKTLWHLHIEGVPYRAIAKAFSNQSSKWLKDVKAVPNSLKQSRSVFWAHTHMQKILHEFWAWASLKGLDDPRSDVSKSRFTE
jgi:hypothetical protein